MPGEPKTIGRYEVRGVLGHGAMGRIYLAFDPLLKRFLAIKTVRDPESERAASLVRFQREGQLSARLSHPNIVTVHDVGQDPEVGPFLAMEYIDGVPLADLIQQGLPTEGAIHLLIQGMSALRAAGKAGITHRDVKPSNFIVSRDGRLKLMDFGIARGDDSRLTRTGAIMGTPSFTAPEALSGEEPGASSDHYAFAVTAFQMLTSQLPFECGTIAATLFRIVHEPPLFPDGMRAPLRAVFEKALGKRPRDRYPSLESFLRELIGAVDLPEPTRARFLAGLDEGPGAELAQLIRTRADAARAFQAQPAPQAYRSAWADPAWADPAWADPAWADPASTDPGVSRQVSTVPMERPRARPGRARRRAAAALLGAALLAVAAAWWLQPRPFTLEVASLPEGATVLLDGKEVGRSNLAGVRIPGSGGTVRLELDGYEPQETAIRPGSGPVRMVLTRPRYAVRVVSDPPGAAAFLNGVAQGTTPIPELQVPVAGRQELVLRLPDRLEWSRVLARGEPLPDPIRLVRRSAPEAAPPAAALPVPPPVPGSAPVPAPPAPALLARPPASAHLARPPADERGH